MDGLTLRDAFLVAAYRQCSEEFFAASWMMGVSNVGGSAKFERYLTELLTTPLEPYEEEDLPALRAAANRALSRMGREDEARLFN